MALRTGCFGKLAPRFLGFEIAEPAWVCPDELYATKLPTAPAEPPVRISVPA